MGLLELRSKMRDTGDRVRQFATAKLLGTMTDGANLPDDEQRPPQGGLLATPPFNPNAPQGLPNQNPSPLTPQAPPSALLQQSNQGLLAQMMGENPMQGAGPGLSQGRSTSPGGDPNHAHRKGVRGLIRHAFGADRISPAVGAALSPEDREHFLNRGILSQLIERSRAGGEEKEAINTMNLRGLTQARDLSAQRLARFEEIKKQAEQMPIGPERSEFYARALAELEPEAGVATNTAVGLREREFAPRAPRAPITKNTAEGILQYNLETEQWEPMVSAAGTPQQAPPVAPAFQIPAGTVSANGNPIVFNSKTGQAEERTDLKQAPPRSAALARAVGGIGQGYESRLMTAVNEAPFILKRMNEFEAARMKDGKFTLPLGSVAAAQIQAGAQRQDAIGAATQEIAGRMGDPDVNQYFADAARTARLMQLISARGGSEAMVGQESRLFRAQPRDDAAKVTAARQARETMIGQFGAVMQVLTPEQKQKLAVGLAAIEAGKDAVDLGDGQKMTFAELSREVFGGGQAPGIPKKPMAARVAELATEGKTKEQALVILKREGYNP